MHSSRDSKVSKRHSAENERGPFVGCLPSRLVSAHQPRQISIKWAGKG
jgi:hypothetical protein